MKIAGVEFPQPLLNALLDNRLVVFAGAGVSMGPPANLPSFRQLAEQVADGTEQSIGNDETEDRFLGRLKASGVNVHQRAADILQRDAPEPTELHRNLLRLYGSLDDVRVVTTNFDLLFEQSAAELFSHDLKVFQAPVLPLGSRFHGIVHPHGAVNEPEETVLTHLDFGRAYLTEADGWARRFMVDLFANYTVLFVGYSHNDTIMTYLTPSLPPDDAPRRFALIGDHSGESDHWRRMGAEPIEFPQEHDADFSGLSTAVAGLANHAQSRILSWRQSINDVASGLPPSDDESAGIVDHAMATPEHTQFFVESARNPEWIDWLYQRGHLDCLFSEEETAQQKAILSFWLAREFAVANPEAVFSLIGKHHGNISSDMWTRLAWAVGDQGNSAQTDMATVVKWVHFLTGSMPPHVHESTIHNLHKLAEVCSNLGAFQGLLQLYDAMTKPRHEVRLAPEYGNYGVMYQHYMSELWKKRLKPNLEYISHSLLEHTVMRLEERHSWLQAWESADKSWDRDSFRRSAIEPHEQDNIPSSMNVIIDVARGCLEWLATNDTDYISAWCTRFAKSEAPLLRRLAIHAMSAREDLSADDKIIWLLERCDVNEVEARHEIFYAAKAAYPQASTRQRAKLITAISAYQAPAPDIEDHLWPQNRRSAYRLFSWFHWLHTAAPDCEIAETALGDVREQYPDFVPSEYPDLTHWTQVGDVISPWTAEALLTMPATEALPDLLTYQPTDRQKFDGHDRWAMLSAVNDAAQSNPSWGLDLADAMVEAGTWDSDLWYHVITAWAAAEFDQDGVRRALSHLSSKELHRRHPREIASVLSKLAQSAQDAEAMEWLAEANQIAIALRPHVAGEAIPDITSSVGGVPQYVNWLQKAINHASGQLALFWAHSARLWKQQNPNSQSLNSEYQSALDAIVKEAGVSGQFGRTVLASQLNFFLAVDETWAIDNLLPLFDVAHDDFQCAWDGILTWGSLSPSTAERIRESAINAVPRIVHEFDSRMLARFVEFYVTAMGWLIQHANDEWITRFFRKADAQAKEQFALQIGRRLRSLDENAQVEWWNVWLKDYWHNRLQGVPGPLDNEENAQMLEWVVNLPGVFPEAVGLATKMPKATISHSLILHDVGESELIERHPIELARFLVHLGQCNTDPLFWMGTQTVFDSLLEMDLPTEIATGLREIAVTRHLG